MGENLGQSVVVENVGGGGGMTGSMRVAQSALSHQVRRLEQDSVLAEALARDYRRHAVGGFTVWLRVR